MRPGRGQAAGSSIAFAAGWVQKLRASTEKGPWFLAVAVAAHCVADGRVPWPSLQTSGSCPRHVMSHMWRRLGIVRACGGLGTPHWACSVGVSEGVALTQVVAS